MCIYIAWLCPPKALRSSGNPRTVKQTWFLNIQSLVAKYNFPLKGMRLFGEISDYWTGTGKIQCVFGTFCFAKKKGST